ncbi:hypothetical protein CS0771_61560 [Catellatospora sp. IY07-71]|uniref:hypothetical protein n=1 Tax=Catellatospora sp. IY07-71 TaxID=2728827 RepID=UPI001BB30242|nr:hypothetical protein [Catellatospora sp. IY07-71]BCJ76612.1 hypothetical protein CS0771_61560 [Catellatospora sp. IY07-71]
MTSPENPAARPRRRPARPGTHGVPLPDIEWITLAVYDNVTGCPRPVEAVLA